jgi:hypothetical protein
MYVHTYIHTYIYTHIHTYIHTYTHTYIGIVSDEASAAIAALEVCVYCVCVRARVCIRAHVSPSPIEAKETYYRGKRDPL